MFHSKPKADATLVYDQETPRCLLRDTCVQCTRSPIRYCWLLCSRKLN